ncbi:MAG: hypothetical protein AAGG50_18165 [Bacteroidota bacterium]
MYKAALLAAAGVLFATGTVANLRADADLKADSQLTETGLLAQRTAATTTEDSRGGVLIGGIETDPHTGWSIESRYGALMYYTIRYGTVFRTVEGRIVNIEETQSVDVTDVEAMTFADDGTLYFINDGEAHPSSEQTRHALYRVSASELDRDSSTPVQAERLGGSFHQGNADDLMGLVFQDGTLYGLTYATARIARVSTETGAVEYVSTFDGQGRAWGGLTRGEDGRVYLLGNPDDGRSDAELWRFDDFPQGTPTLVATLTGVRYSEAISAHPDGYLYVVEGSPYRSERLLLRVNPQDGSFTTQPMSQEVQAFEFYYAGEEAALSSTGAGPGYQQ